jgi:hypothetical protein
LENSADAVLKPASRSQSGDASRRSRKQPGRSGGIAGAGSITRHLLVISLASAVFLVGFICDTGALAGLFWASLAGQVGLFARLAAFAVLLLLACVFFLSFVRPARLPPAKPRRGASPRTARNEEKSTRTKAVDSDPADIKPTVTRGRRKKPGPALNQLS